MKKNILVAGLLLAFASINSFAQTTAPTDATPQQHMQRPMADAATRTQKMTERLTNQLGLDAGTAAKVHDIVLARDQKIDELMKSGTKDQAALKANKEQFVSSMKGVLTADQFTKFQAMDDHHGGHGDHGKGGMPMDAPKN